MAPKEKIAQSLKNEILKLWRDPLFSGSFSGIGTFQDALKFEKNINVPYLDLLDLMKNERDFITSTRPVRKFPRRQMDIHGYGTLWQADLAEMPVDDDFKYFLLCVNVFSSKIFCRAMKNKSSIVVKNAFEMIFREAGLTPEKLETDQGSEFLGNKSYFKEKKIFF